MVGTKLRLLVFTDAVEIYILVNGGLLNDRVRMNGETPLCACLLVTRCLNHSAMVLVLLFRFGLLDFLSGVSMGVGIFKGVVKVDFAHLFLRDAVVSQNNFVADFVHELVGITCHFNEGVVLSLLHYFVFINLAG